MFERTKHLARWVLALATVSGACSSTPADSGSDAAKPASLASFVDGPWRLEADRAWDRQRDITFTRDPLVESDYQPMTPTTVYEVVLSEAGATVTIGTTPITGTRAATSPDRVTFELSEGTFAGGRFVVWPGQTSLQGELTLYGSGLPIVKSERGALTQGGR